MFDFINKRITIYYAIFTIVSVIIVTPITLHFLSFMLGFNVFLAYIPMLIMWYIIKLQKDIKYSHIRKDSIVLFILFVLFLPNTFYIITDIIHIDNNDFYQHITTGTYSVFVTTTYMKDIIPYIMLLQITFAMIFGIFAGVYSLFKLDELMYNQNIKLNIRVLAIISIMFLSSIGIYIGRFLRFFSWDIFNPFMIIKDLYNEFSLFMVLFIILFTFTQATLYYLYRNIIK